MTAAAFTYDSKNQHLHLHYDTPSTQWSQALPVGNGRLGAMVYGRPGVELLQLNEDSVWYGGAQDRTPRDAAGRLAELRRLIRAGQHNQAEKLARLAFFSNPLTMRMYEPLGQAEIDFGWQRGQHEEEGHEISSYKRWLDLSTATQSTIYQDITSTGKPVSIRRDVIASYPDQVILVRVTASEQVEFVLRLNRTSAIEYETDEFFDSIYSADDRIILHATPGGKNSSPLSIVLGVTVDNVDQDSVKAIGGSLVVSTKACTIAIGAHTTYRHQDPELAARKDVDDALKRSWKELLGRHVTDYTCLFDRLTVQISPDASHVPTDQRLIAVDASGERDPGLVALYHNYGRYLLISSSRPGYRALPANLQGIWNPSFTPPWGSKFTININLQMNYWPAAISNLPECSRPLVDLVERMAKRGAITARAVYGCRGWCAHSYTDIWADTDPHDAWMPATLWPLGGLWIVSDVVEMLKYHYDRDILLRLAPVLHGAVEFILDFLVPSADNEYLVTNPSLSPENAFVDSSGRRGIFCEGSVIDITLIRRAFELCLWMDSVLQLESPTTLAQVVNATLSRLPPVTVSPATGLIQEWGLNDYDEQEPGHRHVSHLVGLYPGRYINSNTPKERDAAKRVLERRAQHGGGHTGWSRAWLINLHARLGDAEGAASHVSSLLAKSTMPNMLDDHPPFQIDGNFGGSAGVLECLVQSRLQSTSGDTGPEVTVELLPACPPSWAKGKVDGVCVLGGWSVTFSWENGSILDPINVTRNPGALADTAVLVLPGGGQRVVLCGDGKHKVSVAGTKIVS